MQKTRFRQIPPAPTYLYPGTQCPRITLYSECLAVLISPIFLRGVVHFIILIQHTKSIAAARSNKIFLYHQHKNITPDSGATPLRGWKRARRWEKIAKGANNGEKPDRGGGKKAAGPWCGWIAFYRVTSLGVYPLAGISRRDMGQVCPENIVLC